MSGSIPEGLVDWAHAMGLESHLSKQQLQNGKTIHVAMRGIVEGYNIQLQTSNTAVSRVNNWNNLIGELKNIGIRVGQDEKTKIINGNHDIVFQILARLRDYHQKNQKQTEVDISKIDTKNEISDSSSLLELFILAIMRNFNLTAKESVALLSNDSKYLAHILAKGLKGEFRPVEGLILDLSKNLPQIVSFCRNKENQTFFIRAIKPTAISKSENIAAKGLLLMQGFIMEIPHKVQLLGEHLISTLVLGIRRHPYLIPQFSRFMLNVSEYNRQLLMMIKPETSESDLQNIFLEMWSFSKENERIQLFFQLKGINEIISRSISNIRNSDTIISSLNLIIGLISQNPDLLSDPDEAVALVDNIQSVTLSKVSTNLILIQQLFTLLSIFGKQKNPLAPSIYKIIVSKFQKSINETHSRAFIQNFRETIEDFPTIPFQPIIDSINARLEENTFTMSQIQIDFFYTLLRNQSLDSKGGLMIYNIISKFLIEQPTFTSVCGDMIMILLRRFSTESIFSDMTLKLTKISLAIHFANVKKLSQKRRSVTGTSKIDSEDATQKMRNIVLEQFLYKLVEEGIKEINRDAEPLISYSLMQVQLLGREFGEGLRRILGLFGDPNQILKKYEVEAKKLQSEGNKKQNVKQSKLKESWGPATPQNNRYASSDAKANGHTNSEEGLIRPKLLSRLDGQSMHQSFLGVTPAAQRGLEKYQKVYLSKIQKVTKEDVKKKQEEERQQYLKKVFQRKMLDNGISVKALKDDEFQYIYEFGVKQKQRAKDENTQRINLTYFQPEIEEDRDNKGLEYAMKRYQKILKMYYHEYSGFHKPKALDQFDKIAEKGNFLYNKSLWKLLRDHTLDEFITVKECQHLIKKINYKLDKKFDDPSCLDFEGFEQFIVQASYAMFTRPPKNLSGHPVSQMIDQTISRLRLYAAENRISEKVFEDPDSCYLNQTEAIKELNRKLDENPDYILPEGYKKITEKKVVFTHRIFLDAMSETYKDVYEIVNDLLLESIGVNIIEPFTTYETVARARPNLYQKFEGGVDYHTAKMPVFLKKQVAKIPIKDRQVAKQAGQTLAQILEAVELGHDQIGIKIENKLEKQKKLLYEEAMKRKQEESKKWSERHQKIKSAVQKHQTSEKEKQKQQKQKKAEQKRKIEQQKQKQKKQEERLKKRVEEYQDKKKQDEKRRREQSRQRRKKEKQEEQKKKKESDETRKKIQEIKQKKKQEEMERKKIEDEQARQKKIEDKRRFDEQQRRKKQMVSQYKLGKSGIVENKALDVEGD